MGDGKWGDWFAPLVGILPQQPEIWGMDADTGKILWKFLPPLYRRGLLKGDHNRLAIGSGCFPNPVGNPTLDVDGNFYVGMMDGIIYHLVRESTGPGVKVKSSMDVDDSFSSGGVSIAPGMTMI